MANAQELLEHLLILLRNKNPDLGQVRGLVKDLLALGPCQQEMNTAKEVAVLLLDRLVRPLLAGDREREAPLARLAREIKETENLDAKALIPAVGELATALGAPPVAKEEKNWREAATGSLPDGFQERLLMVLQLLGAKEPWLLAAVEQLARVPVQPPSWESLDNVLASVINHGDLAVVTWDTDLQQVAPLLADLNDRFQQALNELERADLVMGEMLARVTPDAAPDVETLSRVVTREAENFQQHARILSQHLREGHALVERFRGQVRGVEGEAARSKQEILVDPFTGLPNREAFVARLEREMERSGDPFVLVWFRIGNLRGLIREVGRDFANKALAALAGRMRHELRDGDLLSRVSEERFVVIMPRCPPAMASALVKRLEAVADHLRFKHEGKPFKIEITFGVMAPDEGMTRIELLAALDIQV